MSMTLDTMLNKYYKNNKTDIHITVLDVFKDGTTFKDLGVYNRKDLLVNHGYIIASRVKDFDFVGNEIKINLRRLHRSVTKEDYFKELNEKRKKKDV